MTSFETQKTVKICYVGFSGFPLGFAEMERLKLISKALLRAGVDVTVLCRKGMLNPNADVALAPSGVFDGIPYVYASGTTVRPESFFKRNFFKIRGLVNELLFLKRWARSGSVKCLLLSTRNFMNLVFYVLASKIFRAKTVMNSVELESSFRSRENRLLMLNDFLFERLGYRLVDGALPISHFLGDFINTVAPKTPILRVPVVCDMEKIVAEGELDESDYFLYCGSTAYLEIISFILAAFDLIRSNKQRLLLVCHGAQESMNSLYNEIERRKKAPLIQVHRDLPYQELIRFYKRATGLLIPLRPNTQDRARFPHKIAEYAATGRPIITTRHGEVPFYFEDMKTAVIAENYDITEFAEKMELAIKFPEEMNKIGIAARKVAQEEFDYSNHGDRIISFVYSL